MNYTHIVLILKVQKPDSITQFSPISLYNVVYRIASKMVANRLRRIVPNIISETQSAFIPGRLITGNILVAHEFHLRGSMGHMSVKLDMSKAFDRLEWSFIYKRLSAMGFPQTFVDLIKLCISSVTFSFILNGSELGLLQPRRGIRQGDPLSPYLFIICSEVFSSILSNLMNVRKLKGIGASSFGPRLSHLLFADDTLLFGEATDGEAKHMQWAISIYETISGQQMNTEKSGIMFSPNTQPHIRRLICENLKIPETENHGKYLGLPSEIGRSKTETFQALQEKVRSRIDGWTEKNLSKAGKELLIKSVVQAIPCYAMSCFELPGQTLENMEIMVRSFWWGDTDAHRKIHWAVLQELTKAKSAGGLGFKDFHANNLAFLGKQAWRPLTNP